MIFAVLERRLLQWRETEASFCFYNTDKNGFTFLLRLRSIAESTSVCGCVCVCLFAKISPEHARSLSNFWACCLRPCLCPPPAVWRNIKGKGQFCGFSSPLYSIGFGTHTKTAQPIEMPFVTSSRLGSRSSVAREWRFPKGNKQCWGKHVPHKANTPNNCELDWSMQRSNGTWIFEQVSPQPTFRLGRNGVFYFFNF